MSLGMREVSFKDRNVLPLLITAVIAGRLGLSDLMQQIQLQYHPFLNLFLLQIQNGNYLLTKNQIGLNCLDPA